MGASWLERLAAGDIVLLDGGKGSELRRRGIELDTKTWSGRASGRHLETLRAIHADYLAAGADIIVTSTFATTRFVLEAAGLGEDVEDLNLGIVAAALETREDSGRHDVAVGGALSCFPPNFDIGAYPDPEAELAAYRELAGLLARAGVDLIALEMLEDDVHGARALTAALETGLPVMLGVSARVNDDEVVVYDFPRQPFAPILDALLSTPPAVVSVMHTHCEDVAAAVDLVRARWTGPLGAYPEIPRRRDGRAVVTEPELVAYAENWVRHGVRLLGGCCGSEPRHIAALRDARATLLRARRIDD